MDDEEEYGEEYAEGDGEAYPENPADTDPAPESPESFALSPEEATGFAAAPEAAGFFNRKRTLVILCSALSLAVAGGFLARSGARNSAASGEAAARAASRSPEFLRTQRDRALAAPLPAEYAVPDDPSPLPPPLQDAPPETVPQDGRNVPPPPPAAPPSGGGRASGSGGGNSPAAAALRSPLVPASIEGSLFPGRSPAARENPAERYPYADAEARGQEAAAGYLARVSAARDAAPDTPAPGGPYTGDNRPDFYNANAGGAPGAAGFLGENSLWIGTVVPAVLETGVNTDLPGGIIARVTRHVYDSLTGKTILIPQGTLLTARYNSSVSYAQNRVQIAWDTMVRPDGFFMELGGMNGVDRAGLSGQEAERHENWFEYLKAAGLITMFSVANSKMTEEAARYSSADTASAAAQANTAFVNQTGGNIVSRAMNIQPTLTVD